MPKLSRLRSALANKSWSANVAPRHQRRVRVNKMKGPKECCAVSVYVKRHFFLCISCSFSILEEEEGKGKKSTLDRSRFSPARLIQL